MGCYFVPHTPQRRSCIDRSLLRFIFVVICWLLPHVTMEFKHKSAVHWFRKGLRLHDNPALLDACRQARSVYPVFIIDPVFAKPEIVGTNRYQFLIESLQDLDCSLKRLGSRLYVFRGKPADRFPDIFRTWGVDLLTFETDTEPYAIMRDKAIRKIAADHNVAVTSHASHTLYDMEHYVAACEGKIPFAYGPFTKLFKSMPPMRTPADAPDKIPVEHPFDESQFPPELTPNDVPTLLEMGYMEEPTTPFKGGETEALRRVRWTIDEREEWAAGFRKPETSPNSLEPSTTVLSPYLKFGCLSPNLFFHKLRAIEAKYQGRHSLPPESLTGQMMWREFFYMCSYVTPNFDKMVGNPRCRQIPWDWDRGIVQKWRDGQTGYPFIDAIMTQLKVQGWIHHLARHAVACFLTRGDLWQHWEAGMQVFDELLIDDDWAINAANWLWLSCSCYFYFFYRCYSPVTFGKKTDKNGDYIRRWLPVLAKMPAQYIYEPWEAPHSVQVAAGCVVGRDYPVRIVIHEVASKRNMERMRQAYSEHAAIHGGPAVPGGVGSGSGSSSVGNSGSSGAKARKRGTNKSSRTSSSDSGSGSSLTGSGVSSESDEAAASGSAAASASGERKSSHHKKRSKRSGGGGLTPSDSSTSTASTASSHKSRSNHNSSSSSKKK